MAPRGDPACKILERKNEPLIPDGLAAPREEIGEQRCQVMRETQTDGLVEDKCGQQHQSLFWSPQKQQLENCFVTVSEFKEADEIVRGTRGFNTSTATLDS